LNRSTSESGRAGLRRLGFLGLALLLLLILVPVVALTFSVKVSGHSMDPTLADGDRLLLDIAHRHDIRRFDLVEATTGEGGANVVKRVIGLPGDRVQIPTFDPARGQPPVVYVVPAGEDSVYRVDHPTWAPQVGDEHRPCCQDNGEAAQQPRWVTVPEGHYWLLGDNWGGSDDSRVFGFIDSSGIGGRLNLRLMPLGDIGEIADPASLVPATKVAAPRG